MLKNLTIKLRMIFVIGFLCLLSVVIGAVGLLNLDATNTSVKTLYEDRVEALGQLNSVLSLMQQNQLALSNAVGADMDQLGRTVQEVASRTEKINAEWKQYMATYLTPDEKVIAERFAADREKLLTGALLPAMNALKAKDSPKADEIIHRPMIQLFKPVQNAMADLIKLQLDVSKVEYAESKARFASAKMTAVAAIILGLVIGAAMGYWLISGISRSLAQALYLTRSVAEGDLTQTVEISSNDEIGKLLHALRAMNEKLVAIVGQVRTGADTIATASSQIAAGNMDLSARTEQQASSLEETASSMEELTSTVKQNADNARQANQLAITASGIAVKGGAVVAEVVGTMGSINDSAKKIVDIISVIDGIAFQTNILALNAAVEAARAGEQGRGFAVVATEVRSLAQRSAAAAKEIKTLISDSVEKVDAGSKLVAQAGSTMDDVVESVKRVTDIMAEITAASQEQSAGIEQVNQAVSQMDQVTQQNAALVEEAAAAAGSLQDQSSQLVQVVSVFKLDTNQSAALAQKPSTFAVTPSLAGKQTPALPSLGTHAHSAPRGIAPRNNLAPVKTTSSNGWEEF